MSNPLGLKKKLRLRENLPHVQSKTIENKKKRGLEKIFDLCVFDLGRIDCIKIEEMVNGSGGNKCIFIDCRRQKKLMQIKNV